MTFIKKVLKYILHKFRNNEPIIPNLDGDRNIEWSWCIKYLPHNKKVLDIGCCYSIISAVSSRLGNDTVGVDLNNEINYKLDNFEFIQGNFTGLNFEKKFNCIVLASTVEHVGLSGRYNSSDDEDGDLKTMEKVKKCLADGGEVILTIPVGKDAVFKPFHRIYGQDRLSKLLQGFEVLNSEFWLKADKINWIQVNKERALQESGSAVYYALGLFRIKLKD